MGTVYWIEDKFDTLKCTLEMFAAADASVVKIPAEATAIRSVSRIKRDPGPIIVDLRIPLREEGDRTVIAPAPASAHEVGLRLISLLLKQLGADWPIFVLSGNLSVMDTERLRSDFGFPESRIWPKPLTSNASEFLEAVLSAEVPPREPPARESS